MTERPILFNGDMVRAILAGNKTQTRRPVKFEIVGKSKQVRVSGNRWCRLNDKHGLTWYPYGGSPEKPLPQELIEESSPFGSPGDLLYVRERARIIQSKAEDGSDMDFAVRGNDNICQCRLRYEVDGHESDWIIYPERLARIEVGRCMSNGCFKEAARIWLRVKSVRVERVQDISNGDIWQEGVSDVPWPNHGMTVEDAHENLVCAFREIWDPIYGTKGFGWDVNLWVWVCEFEREAMNNDNSS